MITIAVEIQIIVEYDHVADVAIELLNTSFFSLVSFRTPEHVD
jgi:hypothetical protein